jgi:hypothetical protein
MASQSEPKPAKFYIERAQQAYKDGMPTEKYIAFLEEALEGALTRLISQDGILSRIRLEEIRGARFIGKKISPENLRLYKEIRMEYINLTQIAGECDFSTAARIVARRNRKQYKNLYPNFIRWKNNHCKD